jgi:long-chain acyl-CoA synthetase
VHLLEAIAVPVAPLPDAGALAAAVEVVDPKVILLSRAPASDQPRRTLPLSELACEGASTQAAEVRLPDPDSEADILLTSGTPGKPTGVVLTHRNIVAAAQHINEFIGNTGEEREALVLPLNHSFGLGRLRCQMLAGGTLVFTEGLLFPKKLFEAMACWRTTGIAFVPAGWAMLSRLTGEKLAEFANELRFIEIGSSPMPLEEKRRLVRLFPKTRICMHYGLTEASRSLFIEFHESMSRLDSIGKPSPHVEVRILGDDGEVLRPGEQGSIAVRGDHVMARYWNVPTEGRFRDGWLLSGDIGYRSEDGYLYLEGRQDDVINVGGWKVFPTEVEAALRQHEAVAECVCIGVPDPHGITGDGIHAFLQAREGLAVLPEWQGLRDFLVGKIEFHKVPAVFEWVSSIPRNVTGKVQRHLMKDLARVRRDRPGKTREPKEA